MNGNNDQSDTEDYHDGSDLETTPFETGVLGKHEPTIPIRDECPDCSGSQSISVPRLRLEVDIRHKCGDKRTVVVEYNSAEIVSESLFEDIEVKDD